MTGLSLPKLIRQIRGQAASEVFHHGSGYGHWRDNNEDYNGYVKARINAVPGEGTGFLTFFTPAIMANAFKPHPLVIHGRLVERVRKQARQPDVVTTVPARGLFGGRVTRKPTSSTCQSTSRAS